jgi:tryptophanase
MNSIKFFSGENIPLEMHKVRMVQKVTLAPVNERLNVIKEAGFNTFLLKHRDVFLDMLTDSGVNAMSERQYAAMFLTDDSYAGSETFYRLEEALAGIFGTKYFLPAHQGRACENIIAQTLVKPGSVALMNYHFTTTLEHVLRNGGHCEEIICDEGFKVKSSAPFKGDIDIDKLNAAIKRHGSANISFVRIELGTNLIGGQPVSLSNIRAVSQICRREGIPFICDASLLSDNLYFIKIREAEYKNAQIKDIAREIASLTDITYFSARKLGAARGGGIITSSHELFVKMRELIPLYEGFLTYGGMSTREMEAFAVGLAETMDMDVISQRPIFIESMCNDLLEKGVQVVTPSGGLGCHVDALDFCRHIPQEQFPAGALAAALFIASGVRGMERGTLSEKRNPDGSQPLAAMELVRLAFPTRVFTLSQIKYTADRLAWLHKNRELIGGLEFVEEPTVLRFFFGTLKPVGNWPEKLAEKYREDFGESL